MSPSTRPAFCCHLAEEGRVLWVSKTAAFKFYRYSSRWVQWAITPASATVASNQTTTFTVTPDAGFVVASASGS